MKLWKKDMKSLKVTEHTTFKYNEVMNNRYDVLMWWACSRFE